MTAIISPALRKLNVGMQTRHARLYASYNAAVAGLTPEQQEVSHVFINHGLSSIDTYDTMQFRQVVADFAQKEIAPRAADIDKTNRMPEVGSLVSLEQQLEDTGKHNAPS